MSLIRCTCFSRDHGYAFNEHVGVKCRCHPHCVFTHAEMQADKTWKFPDANTFQLGGVIKSNGQIAYRVRCVGCGKMSGELKKSDFISLIGQGKQYAWTRESNSNADVGVCQVRGCGSRHTELHHTSPRSVFGEQAEDWPLIYLCKKHHVEFHTKMTGYQWNSKGVDAVEPWHGLARSSG